MDGTDVTTLTDSSQTESKSTIEQEATFLRESRKHLAYAKTLNRKAKALSSGYLRSQTYERLDDFFMLAESVQEKQARTLHGGPAL